MLVVKGIKAEATTKFNIKTNVSNLHKRTFKNQPKKYKQSEQIFIYNKNERMNLILSDVTIPHKDSWLFEAKNGAVSLEFDVLSTKPDVERIENEGRAVTRDIDGNFREFIIRNIEDDYGSSGAYKNVYAEGSEYELIDEWLPSYVQPSVSLETSLRAILQGTRFEVGEVDIHGNKAVELRHMTVRKAVNELINLFDGEVRYRVEVDGNRVTRRYVDVFKQRGKNTGKRFEAGKDVMGASRTFDSSGLKTALYAVGAADENGQRLTFSDIEWSKDKGDPADKPKGQEFIADPEALERWGREGGKRHRFGGYDGQEEDPAELLLNAWNELQKQTEIRDTYDFDVIQLGEILDYPHERIRLGDRVTAIVNEVYPPIQSHASIIEYRYNLNDKDLSECTLGNFKAELNTDERVKDLEKDWNDKRGELEKKPIVESDKVREEFQEEIRIANENIEQAKKDLEESMENIEVGKENVIGLEEDLDGLDHAISNKIPIGMAAEDVNSGNTKILGKNLVIDGSATVTGNIGAAGATFFNLGTQNMVAKNATIESGVITGTFDAPQAVIQRATFEDVVVSGRLDGVTGTFLGDIITDKNVYVGNTIYLGDSVGSRKTVDLKYGKVLADGFGLGLNADGEIRLSSTSERLITPDNVEIGINKIYTDYSDNTRFKLETYNQAAQIYLDPGGNIYFLHNGKVVHTFYSNGSYSGAS